MVKHGGAYKSTKRKKELLRQKKQEEKRKKRFNKKADAQQDSGMVDSTEENKNL